MNTTIPSSREPVLEGDVFNRTWFSYFENVFRALRGETDIKLGGLLSVDTSSESNSGTGQTDLISYELSANQMRNNGDVLEIEAWGVYAANANNKTITLKFGSQTILDTGAVAANDGSWKIKAKIIRTDAATQEIITEIISSNSSVADSVTRTAGTQALTSSVDIKITATGGASDDITQYSLLTNLYLNS
jgi:hypothetical protein